MRAKKGDWVRIHSIVLQPEERAAQIPDDTKKVPLELWVKGFLLTEKAEIGEEVEIETIIGRKAAGTLIEINPQFQHSWGEGVPELLEVGKQLREILASKESADE